MSRKPDITLYSLEVSRSIRTAWLLEELGLPYNVISSARGGDFLSPEEFKQKIPTFLRKSPTITDDGVVVQESGAITEYICDHYDPDNRFLPTDRAARAKVREYVAAAEATLILHALPIFFAKTRMTAESDASARDNYIAALTPIVQKDLDWLEQELNEKSKGSGSSGAPLFFVGDSITAADTMLLMSVQTIFGQKMGTEDGAATGRWKLLQRWMEEMEARKAYQIAVEKAGYRVIMA